MHRRQSRGERQRVDTNPVGGYQRLGTNIKGLRSALERLEGGRDILGSPAFQFEEVASYREGRCLILGLLEHGGGIASISHDRQPAKTGHHLAQEFESLAGKIGKLRRQAVTLPPGRTRLATKPPPTGSAATAKTIGMSDVACFAARTAPPAVTMTSTLSRTNSAAISAKRSPRPSAQRYSIAMVRPSLQPSSRSRWTKAATNRLQVAGVVAPRNPIVGSFPACCARAPSGQAATPPSSVMMNSRRFIR